MTQKIKNVSLPDCNDGEILRYMGVRGEAEDALPRLLQEGKRLCDNAFMPCACYHIYDIKTDGERISFGDFTLSSRDLATCLAGCGRAIVFVATVGFPIDRLIKKYASVAPATALTLSAIGTERIEAFCDILCEMWRDEYEHTTPRYGIGYGDLALDTQREIFSQLQVTKHIGVTLTDSLLMSPTKSVSAIVGIKD